MVHLVSIKAYVVKPLDEIWCQKLNAHPLKIEEKHAQKSKNNNKNICRCAVLSHNDILTERRVGFFLGHKL